MMKSYRVLVTRTLTNEVEVRATDRDEAEAEAIHEVLTKYPGDPDTETEKAEVTSEWV